MAVEVGVQKMRKKLEELLKERLKADRVSVECEGPEEDRRLMLTVVSPQFRGLTKVEDRDSLIWDVIKAHTHTPAHTHTQNLSGRPKLTLACGGYASLSKGPSARDQAHEAPRLDTGRRSAPQPPPPSARLLRRQQVNWNLACDRIPIACQRVLLQCNWKGPNLAFKRTLWPASGWVRWW